MDIQKYSLLLILLGAMLCHACTATPVKEIQHSNEMHRDSLNAKTYSPEINTPAKSRIATILDSLGLVDISTIDSTIQIKLMYTQPDNFTGQILYDDLKEGYLSPDAAKALARAHQSLKEKHPSYRFIIYDAARPMSIQRKMWNIVKGTSKYIYVSNPARGGGLHNYGLAVDISILDSLGNPLPMGTKVDHLGPEAHITEEKELVKCGKIREQERQNRVLLRQVMKEAGFRALPNEWWHFNFCSRETARRKYKLIP